MDQLCRYAGKHPYPYPLSFPYPCPYPYHTQRIAFQILCGLHYIHTRGILHRFLSPHAIFLRMEEERCGDGCMLDSCQVKLGDFLFARTNAFMMSDSEEGDYTSMNCVSSVDVTCTPYTIHHIPYTITIYHTPYTIHHIHALELRLPVHRTAAGW
ncbi:hypothetical protein EON63_11115 [archaeon]|nr:MAG: hypothetical protein EON63_11115 [archaeon]